MALRELALEAATQIADAGDHLRDHADPDGLALLARALGAKGIWLSQSGRREEALTASEEAVAIYRKLAQDRPDAFLPDLATHSTI